MSCKMVFLIIRNAFSNYITQFLLSIMWLLWGIEPELMLLTRLASKRTAGPMFSDIESITWVYFRHKCMLLLFSTIMKNRKDIFVGYLTQPHILYFWLCIAIVTALATTHPDVFLFFLVVRNCFRISVARTYRSIITLLLSYSHTFSLWLCVGDGLEIQYKKSLDFWIRDSLFKWKH